MDHVTIILLDTGAGWGSTSNWTNYRNFHLQLGHDFGYFMPRSRDIWRTAKRLRIFSRIMQFEPSGVISSAVTPPAVYQRNHLSAYSDLNCFLFIKAYHIQLFLTAHCLRSNFHSAQSLSRPPTYIVAKILQLSDNSPKSTTCAPQPAHYNFTETELFMSLFDNLFNYVYEFGDSFFSAVFQVCGLESRFLCVRFSARF